MDTIRWYFIVNPIAGNGRGTKNWLKIRPLLKKAEIVYDFAISQHAQHAIELATQAVLKGYRQLVAVGGDGTINEVINGIFNQKNVPTNQVTFAVIPIGTGNDWIKTHRIPNNYTAAIQLLNKGKKQVHDIGKVTYYNHNQEQKQRYFINVAGLAYDAFVTKASEKRPKYGNSQFYYLYLIGRCVTQFKPSLAKITFDGQEMEHKFFNITIGQCHYNGGGTNLVPHANPNDGLFALSLFKDIKPWEVIVKAPQFYTGKIVQHKEAFSTQAKHIKIEAPASSPAFVEADGEWLGQSPIEFFMLAASIHILVP